MQPKRKKVRLKREVQLECGILNLSQDILAAIFSFLSPEDIVALSSVNKDLNRAVKQQSVWRHLVWQQYISPQQESEAPDFIKFFKSKYEKYNAGLSRNQVRISGLVRANDLCELKKQLKRMPNFNINFKNNHSESLLMIASSRGHVDIVTFLLESGAKADYVNNDKESALSYSIEVGLKQTVYALINGGASVEKLPENDVSPLVCAVVGGDIEIVRALIDAGANTEVIRDPLFIAMCIMSHNLEAILVLAQLNIDCNKALADGVTTPLLIALSALEDSYDLFDEYECPELFFYVSGMGNMSDFINLFKHLAGKKAATVLVNHHPLTENNFESHSLLLLFSFLSSSMNVALRSGAGNTENIQAIISKIGGVNSKLPNGTTALMLACSSSSTQNVEALLICGADVSAINNKGENAKDFAMTRSQGAGAILNLLNQYTDQAELRQAV